MTKKITVRMMPGEAEAHNNILGGGCDEGGPPGGDGGDDVVEKVAKIKVRSVCL